MCCPLCYSEEHSQLGELGACTWTRCQNCGWVYQIESQADDYPEDWDQAWTPNEEEEK